MPKRSTHVTRKQPLVLKNIREKYAKEISRNFPRAKAKAVNAIAGCLRPSEKKVVLGNYRDPKPWIYATGKNESLLKVSQRHSQIN